MDVILLYLSQNLLITFTKQVTFVEIQGNFSKNLQIVQIFHDLSHDLKATFKELPLLLKNYQLFDSLFLLQIVKYYRSTVVPLANCRVCLSMWIQCPRSS